MAKAISVILVGLALALASGGRTAHADDGIRIDGAWARATPAAARTAALYLTITNTGSAPDTIEGASTPVADKAELYEMTMENGVMEMRPVPSLTLAPGKSLVLKPGGYHLMLTGLKAPLKGGQTVPVTVIFTHAGAQQVAVSVAKSGAMPAADMSAAPAGSAMPGGMSNAPKPLVPFTAPSIMRGAKVYADNCAACHGTGGHGDGPLAKSTPVAPADLTAEHIFGHSDADLFSWISQGIPAGKMPGFAEIVSEHGRWDVINFIHARAAAVQPPALRPEVTRGPAPRAPDFIFERGGTQGTLHQVLAKTPVLLVLYRLPASLPRLQQLASAESRLASAGLGLLAVPIDTPVGEAESAAGLPDFTAVTAADTATAYALFDGADGAEPCEFLIDRAGFLRARWTAEPADATALLAQLDRLAQQPLQERQPHVHVH